MKLAGWIALVTRALIILSIAWFVALGSGAVEYAHNAQHAREDAGLAGPSGSAGGDQDNSASHRSPAPRHHDDTNCAIHAQLHVPLVSLVPVLLLICAGLLVAFVTQIAAPLVSIRIPARQDCRGPPAVV